MKLRITIVAIALLMTVSVALGADIDGKWTGKYDSGMGGEPMNMEYTFKANGNVLTGTTIGGPDNTHIPIADGKIDGNKISFTVAVDMMGQAMKFAYTGELAGDELKLKFSMGEFPGGEFTVKRAK